ncbi:hypothetical protein FRB99_000699 [Tulasnella sp. 403]|nr:hypothetical protein FRB99_000699 [Tulasnella sp. 403]
MADKKQRLVLSILDFLSQSLTDGTIKSDDKEGLEVAIQCIGEAFGVDPEDEQQRERLSIRPATLPSIFDVYLRTKEKLGSSPAERMQSGGGMPSMAEIMGDPALRDLANQFGGGAGGPRGT